MFFLTCNFRQESFYVRLHCTAILARYCTMVCLCQYFNHGVQGRTHTFLRVVKRTLHGTVIQLFKGLENVGQVLSGDSTLGDKAEQNLCFLQSPDRPPPPDPASSQSIQRNLDKMLLTQTILNHLSSLYVTIIAKSIK